MTSIQMEADTDYAGNFDIYNNLNPDAINEQDFDIDKLNSYILIELWIFDITEGKQAIYTAPFRRCKLSDFNFM